MLPSSLGQEIVHASHNDVSLDTEEGRALLARWPDHEEVIRARFRELSDRRVTTRGGPSTTRDGDTLVSKGSGLVDRPIYGPYRVLELIGAGGMGDVFLAEQREPVRRRVALKVVKLGMSTKEILGRFEQERQALALMSHESIARVLDAGRTTDGLPFFVMELVEGEPITEYCDHHKLTLEQRVELFSAVCNGIQHAHLKGVMHRDLKPSNVLVVSRETHHVPKIIDFGLARATSPQLSSHSIYTEAGRVVGTPEYMSPEQARGESMAIDSRTDVYSLGVMLYELVTGALPFPSELLREAGLLEVKRIISETEPARPSTRFDGIGDAALTSVADQRCIDASQLRRRVKGDLDWIIMRAMAKEPERRYQTPAALAEDLARYLGNEPVSAGPPTFGYRAKKFVRRNRTQVLAAILVFLALALGMTSTIVFANRAVEQRELAETKEQAARDARDVARVQKARADQKAVDAEEAMRLALAAEQSAEEEARNAKTMLGFLERTITTASADEGRPDPDLKLRDAFDHAASIAQDELAGSPKVLARMYYTFGQVYFSLGIGDEGLAQFERALAVRQKHDLMDDRQAGMLLVSIADLMPSSDASDVKADRMLDEAKQILERIQGPGHDDLILVEGTRANRGRMAEKRRVTTEEASEASEDRQFAFFVGFLNLALRRPFSDREQTRAEFLQLIEDTETDWKNGRFEEATSRIVGRIEEANLVPNPSFTGQTITALRRFVHWCDETGRPEAALATLHAASRIADKYLPPSAIPRPTLRYRIAERMVNARDFVAAEEHLRGCLDEFETESDLASELRARVVLYGCFLSSHVEGATSIDEWLEHLPTPEVYGLIVPIQPVQELCTLLARDGRLDAALEIGESFLGEPSRVEGQEVRHACFRVEHGLRLLAANRSGVARAQIEAGVRFLEERKMMSGWDRHRQAVTALISLCEAQGDHSAAEQWRSALPE